MRGARGAAHWSELDPDYAPSVDCRAASRRRRLAYEERPAHPAPPRGHDGQVQQDEEKILHAPVSVGQTSGITQRRTGPAFGGRIGIRDPHAIIIRSRFVDDFVPPVVNRFVFSNGGIRLGEAPLVTVYTRFNLAMMRLFLANMECSLANNSAAS